MEFQRRLLQVDQCLSKADVQALAFLCVDLVSKDLSSVSSAEELFSILTDNDLLSSEDTSLLTELLQTCHRQDLIRDFGTFLQPAESCIGPYRWQAASFLCFPYCLINYGYFGMCWIALLTSLKSTTLGDKMTDSRSQVASMPSLIRWIIPCSNFQN